MNSRHLFKSWKIQISPYDKITWQFAWYINVKLLHKLALLLSRKWTSYPTKSPCPQNISLTHRQCQSPLRCQWKTAKICPISLCFLLWKGLVQDIGYSQKLRHQTAQNSEISCILGWIYLSRVSNGSINS